jgi:3-methylcrotonyl-CoA carboxylase alpha subunit
VRFTYRIPGEDEAVEVEIVPLDDPGGGYRATVRECVFDLPAGSLRRAAFLRQAGEITVQMDGREYRLYDGRQRRSAPAGAPGDLHAPMAGRILRMLARAGDSVRAGDALLILEAMKMEQQITAPHDGMVASLLCEEGDQVAAGQELVVLRDTGKT